MATKRAKRDVAGILRRVIPAVVGGLVAGALRPAEAQTPPSLL
jgi:hypothetical protein